MDAFAGHGRLAFISRNTIWVLDGGRRSLRRTATARGLYPLAPSFSPDGRWLAFVQTKAQPASVAGGVWDASQMCRAAMAARPMRSKGWRMCSWLVESDE
jgi:Tol biopolymer transport system component